MMTKKFTKQTVKTLPIWICILLIQFSCSTWKKKQFENCDEMASSFKNVDYDDIVKEFGQPKETFEHWNGYGCDGDKLAFEAMWSGVGVGGKDSRIFFRAYELSPGRLSAAYCCTVECE